jgi:hypothetical protein
MRRLLAPEKHMSNARLLAEAICSFSLVIAINLFLLFGCFPK